MNEELRAAIRAVDDRIAAAGKAGPRKPLGVILVARGLLTDEKLLDLLEEQRRLLAEQAAGVQSKKDDALFGQILVKQGLATPDQVHAALRAQAEAAERGEIPVPRLGQILMTLAPAQAPAIRKTLELQDKAVYTCPECSLRYNLRQADPGKQYRSMLLQLLHLAPPLQHTSGHLGRPARDNPIGLQDLAGQRDERGAGGACPVSLFPQADGLVHIVDDHGSRE